MNEADQLGQVGQRIGLEHAFGAGGGGDGAGVKRGIDRRRDRVRIRLVGQMHLQLRDRTDFVLAASPLQKIQMRVDQPVLGRVVRLKYSGNLYRNLADRELVAGM